MSASAPGGPPRADDRAGHRERLRQRFLEGGSDALPDYELLELLLFQVKARGDVKPLAKSLLAEFGGIAELVGADPARLAKLDGVGPAAAAALKVVEATMHRALRERAMNRPAISNWQALLDYCRGRMQDAAIEHFRVLFLDRKNVLIADESQQKGTIDHTPIYPREVMRRALDLGASAVILVHNHPSGDPTPSRQDIETTKRVVEAGKALGVEVHDHIVVGRRGHASFKALRLM